MRPIRRHRRPELRLDCDPALGEDAAQRSRQLGLKLFPSPSRPFYSVSLQGVFGRRKDREGPYIGTLDGDFGGASGGTTALPHRDKKQRATRRSPTPAHDDLPPSRTLPSTPSEATPRSESAKSTSLFNGATALQFEDFRYIDASGASNVVFNSETPGDDSSRGWETLAKYASPNAFHNSRARHNSPRCDDDTRVEVLGEIMGWLRDRKAPCRLLCVTGAAGSGKSALQQTVAERCADEGILASTFFFSATDNTRNNASTIVPTIAYQLGTRMAALRQLMGAAVIENPLIFDHSLGSQIHSLIIQPIARLPAGYDGIPQGILIDGLDECHDEGHQAELIMAIRKELLLRDTPFRIFLTSRPEWVLHSALQPHGHLHGLTYHIGLSDAYDATADIRRTLWRRLRDIGACSSFPSAQDPLWPPEKMVDAIVKAASGQYIYVATVIRFVSERRASPVDRLRAFLEWSSSAEDANPFAALDLLYTMERVT
ncbi:hypothetical protein NMY22_g13556 [Coprinellus aureogranulatus]|nr:hypothetical protein NMY22_g13556 [Coprinellus aureogranulatus]